MSHDSLAGRTVLVFGAAGRARRGVAEAFHAAGARSRGRPGRAGGRAAGGRRALRAADVGRGGAGRGCSAPAAPVGGGQHHRRVRRAPAAGRAGPGRADRPAQLNLVTAALITKHALAAMEPVGAGRIVHTASRAGVVTKGSGFAYSVSKAGVLHLVAMAADEVRGTGITVNCVVPSIIDTPANRAAMPDARPRGLAEDRRHRPELPVPGRARSRPGQRRGRARLSGSGRSPPGRRSGRGPSVG